MPVVGSKTFTDSDGDKYRVKIAGPGTLNVALLDPDGDGKGPIDQLFLAGTKAGTNVSVTLVKKVGDGLIPIGDVNGTGKLGSFKAAKSDLVVNGFIYSGAVGTLKVRDVLQPDAILADPIMIGGGDGQQDDDHRAQHRGRRDHREHRDDHSLKAKSIGDATISAPKITELKTTGGDIAAQVTTAGPIETVAVKGGELSGGFPRSALARSA